MGHRELKAALIQIIPELIPRVEQKILCATFLEAVLRFYEDPKNQDAFERWRAGKGGNAIGQTDSGAAAAGLP